MPTNQTPGDTATFFDNTVDRFGGWVQYGDTKAGAVLVVLGLGLSDLVSNAPDLIGAHNRASGWGRPCTVVFVIALLAALGAVLELGRAVFPHAPAHDPANESLLYYRDVAARDSAAVYQGDVAGLTVDQLNAHRANEAYGLAKIAEMKAARTSWAFTFAGLFLVCWPLARVALALAR